MSYLILNVYFCRVRRNYWPSCIGTWTSTVQSTMRRSAPQRCLHSWETTACCLSRSYSSFWGKLRCCFQTSEKEVEICNALETTCVLNVTLYFFIFSQLFMGLGFPYEGPAPLEAIANGCVFLQPKFNPPRSSLNHEFFRGKPTSREVCVAPLSFPLFVY